MELKEEEKKVIEQKHPEIFEERIKIIESLPKRKILKV